MPFNKLCPLLGSMLQKHKSINHTQTYSEKHSAYPFIIQGGFTSENGPWVLNQTQEQERSSHFFLLSTEELGYKHSRHSSLKHGSPWAEKKAQCLFPVWNTKSLFLWSSSLLHHACLPASVDPFSFWLCCELSSSASHTHRGDNVLSA